MAGILQFLPDPACTHQSGSLDPPKTTFVSLAAMAERAQPLHGPSPPRRAKVPGRGCCQFTDGIRAHVRTPGGPAGPAQPLPRSAGSPPAQSLNSSLTQSNRRGTDPYARWCGRGAARRPPIPINPHHTFVMARSMTKNQLRTTITIPANITAMPTARIADTGSPKSIAAPIVENSNVRLIATG